ncbi:MAG: hypothetical protein U0625_05820 [Phycisphaerales bacterium]
MMFIRSLRTLSPSRMHALAAAVALGASSAAAATDKHWNVATGNWGVGGNWSPAGIPQPADNVFIGDTVAAENEFVFFTSPATVASLIVTDGMRIQMDNAALAVTNFILLSGENTVGDIAYASSIRIGQGLALDDLSTDDFSVQNEGSFDLVDGARLRVDGYLEIGTTGRGGGVGTIRLNSNAAVAMRVNGFLNCGVGGLTIEQAGLGRIDLDGNGAEQPSMNITGARIDGSAYASLTIHGTSLTDDFDGDMMIGLGNHVTMDLSDGWEMSASANLTMLGFQISPNATQCLLDGGPLLMRGTLEVLGDDGPCRIAAPITVDSAAVHHVGSDAILEFLGATDLQSAALEIDQGGVVWFKGPTTVHQLSVTTPSVVQMEGYAAFSGPATWDGVFQIDGYAEHYGTATVVGPTTISGTVFDLDGGDGNTVWNVQNGLTVNLDRIDSDNYFDGEFNIAGGFLGRVGINLSNPTEPWVLRGALTTAGVGAIAVTRVTGSPLSVIGDLSVTSGKAVFAAPTELALGSLTSVTGATTELRLNGGGRVQAGATFSGDGTIVGGAGTALYLEDGANLGSVGVRVEGKFEVGSSPGAAFVDQMTFGANSLWSVELGGPTPQAQHDLLFVTGGPAALAGTLDVQLLDLGGGLFDPVPGDSFIILRGSAGISGSFANSPVSYGNGKVYIWAVDISKSLVELRLADTVPCPADLNSDGRVDGADLGILLGSWGACGSCPADLNQDGVVDGADLGMLLGTWGSCL